MLSLREPDLGFPAFFVGLPAAKAPPGRSEDVSWVVPELDRRRRSEPQTEAPLTATEPGDITAL